MPAHAKKDYYEVLAIERSASSQEIKSAYRKLAMQHHPDRNPGDSQAEEKFKQASEAYSILADPDKRSRYDRFGHAGVAGGAADGGGFGGLDDILGDLFGFGEMFGGAGRRNRAQRGADLREDLTLEFAEAVFGLKIDIRVRRREPCTDCQGTGAAPGKLPEKCSACGGQGQVRYQQGFFSVSRSCNTCQGTGMVNPDPCKRCRGDGRVVRERTVAVSVPPGVEDGTRIKYPQQGEAGKQGGPAGDLYVVLRVKEHPFFDREGKDLRCVMLISFPQAALGADLIVPTMDGDHRLKIPEGTEDRSVFRIRGKGVPVLEGHGKGDLYVEVRIPTPKHLSKRQRDLLEELNTTLRVENKPQPRTLLGKVKDIFG